MKEYVINKNDAGQRLDKYLTKSFDRLPKSLMYKYIRLKRIKLNGKRAEISTRLNEGDVLSLYINDELLTESAPRYDFLSAPDVLDIVYEDENVMLINKPQGLIVHPDDTEYRDTLIMRVQHYLYNKGEYKPNEETSFKPALVNRIDRNTGGIVIAAKTAQALRVLNEKLKNREIDKYYLCVVHGKMPKKEDVLTAFLEKDEDKNLARIRRSKTDDSRSIRTRYRVIAQRDDLSLLEIELLTGRTHQIRAHLASVGHPLLGDGKYGKNAADRKRGFKCQALWSYRLKFAFETDAEELQYLSGREYMVDDVWFARELFEITPSQLNN